MGIYSVRPNNTSVSAEEENEDFGGVSCPVNEHQAVTSNETLKQWLPKLTTVCDLLKATESTKTQSRTDKSPALVRVTYQTPTEVTWEGEESTLIGRTLEEAFALENLKWCQDEACKPLGLRVITKSKTLSLEELHTKLFKRVNGTNFKKTDFALALMMEEPDNWKVPRYIAEGLEWLSKQLVLAQPAQEVVELSND